MSDLYSAIQAREANFLVTWQGREQHVIVLPGGLRHALAFLSHFFGGHSLNGRYFVIFFLERARNASGPTF